MAHYAAQELLAHCEATAKKQRTIESQARRRAYEATSTYRRENAKACADSSARAAEKWERWAEWLRTVVEHGSEERKRCVELNTFAHGPYI